MAQHIEFFFDFSSPYSYLASTQISRVAERAGATFEAKPFVLSAVFKASENTMPAAVPAKAAYLLRDIAAWARDYGVGFQLNPRWPFNAMKAHRLVLAVEDRATRWRVVQRFFRAFWAEDADLTNVDLLGKLLADAGADPQAAFAKHETQEIKDLLRSYTDDAIARGAFGAPSIFVHGQMFVGNDRLSFVERAAKGERVHVET